MRAMASGDEAMLQPLMRQTMIRQPRSSARRTPIFRMRIGTSPIMMNSKNTCTEFKMP